MKKFLQTINDSLADAALLEMGVPVTIAEQLNIVRESIEENLIEVAFAEAADYDQIHEAILREHHRLADDTVRPDDCQYGDNDACLV
jgi:hypothetical protein